MVVKPKRWKKSQELPLDIMYEILLSLPVKTLSKFRAVSKPWNSLISRPRFQQDYYRCSEQNSHLLIVTASDDKLLLSTYSNNKGGLAFVKQFSKTVKNLYEFINIFGSIQSCRGWVCLQGWTSSIICIHPSTEVLIALPPSESCRNRCIGFGYASSTQEFKVVIFHFCRELRKVGTKVLVLGSNFWRESKSPPFGSLSVNFSLRGADVPFVYGALHLLHPNGNCYTILAFDIQSEEYKEIALPKDYNKGHSVSRLKELGGSLCLVECTDALVQLWLLKDNKNTEWVRVYNIDFSSQSNGMSPAYHVEPLVILSDGSILILRRGGHLFYKLQCYNPRQKIFTTLLDFRGKTTAALVVESFQMLK